MATRAETGEQRYSVGVMKVEVEEAGRGDFHEIVDVATRIVEEQLADLPSLHLHLFEFLGPHLSAVEGTYSPLDFLKIGLTEKIERDVQFLLVVTEVDLSATINAYVLALPSQLTNIGIISTKRLAPEFWGEKGEEGATARRLASLMMHTLGHLLNLPHHDDPTNLMHDFATVEELMALRTITPEQVTLIQRNIPIEAREEVATGEHQTAFMLRQIRENWASIWGSMLRANPIRLALQLPTMLTAAFSLVIVLFFTAEIWDVATTLSRTALMVFSLIAILGATSVLYQAFNLNAGAGRGRGIAESTIVIRAATLLSLLLTIVLLYFLFFALSLFSALTFFPAELKVTWPTAGTANSLLEHLKLGMFLAAMGVLGGSLGASADSKVLIRRVLFVDEET